MVADEKTIVPCRARRRRWVVRSLVGATVIVSVLYLTVSWRIGSAVREARECAIGEYDGDQVSALIAYVDAPAHSLRERDRAVWALGQLGDARALPVLEKYATGEPCDHDHALCQRELTKATELCRGGLNITALVWRHGSLRP